MKKRIIVAAALAILMVVLLSTAVIVKSKLFVSQEQINITYSFTAADIEEVDEFFAHCHNSIPLKIKYAVNSEKYIPVKCEFGVISDSEQSPIIKKAIVTSDEFDFIYDSKSYNICEAPIEIEKSVEYDFYIYLFVEKDDYLSVLNGNSSIHIRLK